MGSSLTAKTRIGAGNDDNLTTEVMIRIGEGDEFLAIDEAQEG